ncbi:anaerobic C4-dicarboxylate transporter family protein [Bradyrhizobium sp. GCM10027634]|uniref:anaerobic C4-dicarboxylate transporter family protein n=1 Tax=unclassified Bradyrhizobium TaxID=2631580 RepID=UPI00188B7706|nr:MULTISPECIES: anaerobic C4-dicarboxylate transporter [unclassified Bradyrhizobium]MDN5004048.1 anaerobic C4-dicarboxylate transporter [Bradyrhizobium sp. WYCCWR 12677]QOZ44949.1 C4-dicarboxylate ABC transporter [Bradyrhizobium sp. CCBAU 53340]
MWLIEFAVVLCCIFVGARLSGIGIGLAGGFGLLILVFCFGLQPTSPPIDVMLIILAVITMVSTMHAAGGLDYLVDLAEKILRQNPARIILIAPVVTYCLALFCGTAYVAFALYPVIVEAAYDAGVRPERPLSIATVAASQAVTASPMSAATAVLIALVSPHGITIGQILLVCAPAGLIGVLVGALSVYRRGFELDKDPEFQRRLAAGEIAPPRETRARTVAYEAKLSVVFFAVAVVSIVTFGSMPKFLPSWAVEGKIVRLSMPNALEMIMLSFAFLTTILLRIKTENIVNSSIFRTGLVAVVAIFGIAWMVDTFFSANRALLVDTLGQLVRSYPHLFGLSLMAMAALVLSQGAAIRALGPLGLTLGISAGHLVGFFHAASAVNIIPATGAVIGSVSIDRTGTTKIGKFVFNHSFLVPGLVSTVSSVLVAYAIASVLLGGTPKG